ncbi:MAG: hypothetical protein Q8J71_01085 [Brevundimonas sp.]|nr:hypothetical protein [Brevundimonas sp.]
MRRLDAQNQRRYRLGPGAPGIGAMTTSQMVVLTEGIFLAAFRAYETFLEEIFVLYVMGKKSRSSVTAHAFLKPRSSAHAIQLMQSSMPYLEWNTPDKVIARAELYLRDGEPIKSALTRNRAALAETRWIRNRIAHGSGEAQTKYQNVVRTALRTMPLKVPLPGEFLMMTDPRTVGQYFLVKYLDVLQTVADDLSA